MKKTVTLNDKTFEVMIPAHEIDRAVAAVAERLNADYGDKERPIFVGVLNGAFMFLSDLIKKIDFTCEISFVKLASYEGTCSTGNVECLLGLNNDIAGRHVIIVEDIVDTGASIEHTVNLLKAKAPASIAVKMRSCMPSNMFVLLITMRERCISFITSVISTPSEESISRFSLPAPS